MILNNILFLNLNMERRSSSLSLFTTFTTIERRYKKCTYITSIFLAITAAITLVTSTVLITSFSASHWGAWNDPLVIGPYIMIGLSIYQLLTYVVKCINEEIGSPLIYIVASN